MKTFSFLFIFLNFLACNNKSSGVYSVLPSEVEQVSDPISKSGETTVDVVPEENTLEVNQKIIKDATLRFETNDIEKTKNNIIALTQTYKGYVQRDYTGKQYNAINQNIVVRIPSKNFNAFIAGVAKDVPFFDEKSITQQDVTAEFIDIEARLKTKKALEKRYLELLNKAKNISEILEIEKELAKIREEIEAKEGRLKYLSNRVSYSTVQIEFYKITAVKSASTSYWQKMKNSFKGGWNGVSVFFLGLLYLWPFFLLTIIIIFIIRRIFKKNKK